MMQQQSRADVALFSAADQDRLAKAVGELKGCTLRSFRKGALLHLAALGASDENLQMLSGHKRRDTLLRYLGWGVTSSSAQAAAEQRAALDESSSSSDSDGDTGGAEPETPSLDDEVLGGAADFDDIVASVATDDGGLLGATPARILPPKMGLRSGYLGFRGRRVKGPPPMFPASAPSATDLGLPRPAADDVQSWPIHVKRVSLVDWDAVERLAADDAELLAQVRLSRTWVESDAHYKIDWAPLSPGQIPLSRFTPEEVDIMVEYGKLVPHEGPIRSFVTGWLIPQAAKRRRRIIIEPFINRTLDRDAMPALAYPSRLERRAEVHDAEFQAEFDMSAWYDQFALAQEVLGCYTMRTRGADGRDRLHDCTRKAMGVCFAVGTAQTVTWVATYPIRQWASTCIDNVRIAANSPRDFLAAVKTFLGRCDAMRITLNDRNLWNLTDTEILQRGRINRIGPFLFLGERYDGGLVRNTERNVANLVEAHRLILLPGAVVTRRRFAAIVGLIIFMAHTVQVGLWGLFSLLRAYARLVSPSSTDSNDVLWDAPVTLGPTVLADLAQVVGILQSNTPARLRPLLEPGRVNADFDVVIIVDASATGWAAYVKLPSGVKLVKSGWMSWTQHSAHAEPKAAKTALSWVRTQTNFTHVAVVTDHEALAKGQRRWWSGYGGFSSSFPLNDFFAELYSGDDLSEWRRDVFYVAGPKNPADGPSRSVSVGEPLTVSATDFVFPDVSTFTHPFAGRPPRLDWQV
jgi:hypothetical protein